MKDSFIGNKEIIDYLDTLDKDKENSIFKYSVDNFEELSMNKTNEKESLINNALIKETPYRFVIVIIYCIMSFSNGLQWVTFAAIGNKFKNVYNISTISLDLFSMVFMIAYPFSTFPSSYLISNVSLRLGLSIAAIGTIIAAGLKCFLNYGIAFAYVGQALAAVVQPLILNSPGELAATWRVLVTSLCILANTFGIIFGYIFPTFILNEQMGNEEYKLKCADYLFWEFILCIILCFPLLILIKSKPSIPPSKSQNNYKSPLFKDCLKILFKNKNFILMLIAMTGIMGYINLVGTICNEFLEKYGLDNYQTSIVSSLSNVFGIIGCIITSMIIDKYRIYRKPFLILNCIAILIQCANTFLMEYFTDYAFIISLLSYIMINGSTIPIFACTMDYVAEQTYPVGASISGGIIMSFNQVSGIISIFICDYFLDNLSQYRYLTNIYILIVLMIIPLISLLFMKEELKRHNKELES